LEDEVMSSTNLSRRAILAGAATASALALPAVAAAVPSPAEMICPPALPMLVPPEGRASDKRLRQLWSKYLKQVADYEATRQKYEPVRAAFDAELPPCPEDVLPGHHWKAHEWLWNKHGLEHLNDAWNEADSAIHKTVKAILRTKAESLFGVGVKLTALPMQHEEEDWQDAVKAALQDIDRQLGSEFAANVLGDWS
jgi:hypothetical protein